VPSKAKGSTEEAAMEEGRERAEVDNAQDQTDLAAKAESGKAQDEAEASGAEAQDEERQPSEVFEVKVNPALGKHTPESVEIDGKVFYTDASRNLAEGTSLLNDLEYESISSVKEAESNKQYIVKK
jgi:hypothetical protein